METQQINGAHTHNGTATKATNGKAAQNGHAKHNGSEPDKDANAAKHGKEAPVPVPQPENEAEPKAKPINSVAQLEVTLKVVGDLHRRSIQRVNLISRIKQLEAFEILLEQDNDELEENPYRGCKLIIEDDKNRRFTTTTPGLIRLVSQFIFKACHEKLAEIEASIVLPK